MMSLAASESSKAIIRKRAPLADLTTFRLGGLCPTLYCCQTPAQLEGTVRQLKSENQEFILIGGGSNLVVSDWGVDCAVIRYFSEEPIIERQGDELVVAGSTLLDDLARYAADHGLEGLNYTSGIPGTVGGAVVGNAGAFGRQVGDVITSVRLVSPSGAEVTVKDVSSSDLKFSYRDSILKKTDDIVLTVRFSVKPGDRATLYKEREEILRVRREKHPDLSTYPCAGSFFRNVEPSSKAGKRQAAGWFLDQAGGKSLASGGAKIYEKHANIIVNDRATAEDVFALSQKMSQLVKEHFDLDLVREVRFVGKFSQKPSGMREVIW